MTLFIISGVALFILGLLGVIVHQSYFRKLISLNLFTSGIFLIFISLSMQKSSADALVVALVLTGLVVTLGASAFALMLIRSYAQMSQTSDTQSEQKSQHV